MTEPHRAGTLQISEDMPFQERSWTVQRVAWGVMLVIIVLALLGLFSTGPLSSAERESSDGTLTVGYQRFIRHDGRTTLTVEVEGSQASNGEIELWVTKSYLDRFESQGISPQPDEVRDTDDRRIMVFLVDDPSAALNVNLSIRAQAMGLVSGEAGVVDGPSTSFTQFSYP